VVRQFFLSFPFLRIFFPFLFSSFGVEPGSSGILESVQILEDVRERPGRISDGGGFHWRLMADRFLLVNAVG
jgi:hypothetical protein